MRALPWLHEKLTELDIDETKDMLKKVRASIPNLFTLILVICIAQKGADAARGDDTSTLKDLVASWVNQDFCPSRPLKSDNKQSRGFAHNVCGKLLCPAEWDFSNDR